MPIFLCRWKNGDISIVKARNKDEAIYHLDEFDNAEEADLFQLRESLIDFRLQDDGTLVLNQFGEGTRDEIMKKAYPELERTLMSEDLSWLKDDSPEYQAMIHRAVEAERTRLESRAVFASIFFVSGAPSILTRCARASPLAGNVISKMDGTPRYGFSCSGR